MRNFVRLQVALLLLASAAAQAAMPEAVAAAFKRAGIPTAAVGIEVRQVDSGRIVISHNASTPFNPASTMKLVTTNAALELLGPTYSFTTQALTRGRRSGDRLDGDLILRGNGDPKLVLENFWLLLRRIRAEGVRVINGNLLLDRSAYAVDAADPSQFDGDPQKPYNAVPDALLLNFHALAVRFAPDPAGRRVQVTSEPTLFGYPLHAPLAAAGECGGDWHQNISAQFVADGANFDGTYALACATKVWEIHPDQLSRNRYFELVFRQLWTELGGTFNGAVVDGVAEPDAVLLTQWDSPSMSELIRDTNKFSNNVMARQLFLALGAAGHPATIDASRNTVLAWLHSKSIDATGMVLENGSGLSRNERVSATTLSALLVAAFQSPVMPEFIASLPLVGYDGTMRKRLALQAVAGHAHIKSGSLQEVRSVAGYVLAASAKRYAVVCLINHANAARGAAAQDALLEWIYDNN